MNDEFNAEHGARSYHAHNRFSGTGFSNGNGLAPKGAFTLADLAPFADALGRRWWLLLLGAVVMSAVVWHFGSAKWRDSYTASAQLLRQNSVHVNDVLGDRELEPDTYASLLRAPELLQTVAAQSQPHISPDTLSARLNITSERNSDIMLIAISGPDRESTVRLANLFATEAVHFTQDLQTNAAGRVKSFLVQQLAPLEEEITTLNKLAETSNVPRRATAALPSTPAAPSALFEKLQAAQLELVELQARFKDQYPAVQQQKAKISTLEKQLSLIAAPQKLAPGLESANLEPLTTGHDPAFLTAKLQALESARLTLLAQKQAALSLELHPPGMCRLLAPAAVNDAIFHKMTPKIAILTLLGGLLGVIIASTFVLLAEALDPRLKTAVDVRRVTRLPVVASAGDLSRLSEAEKMNWAFRAWTSLQCLLSPSPNHGFVCGFTSAGKGEGRSTWIKLLADAASERGFRVLTIVARPPAHDGKFLAENGEPEQRSPAKEESKVTGQKTNGEHASEHPKSHENGNAPQNGENYAVVANHVLNSPDEVTQKLVGPNQEPLVQIPLPGWVWDLDRRKQWQSALRCWSQIDNIALLVELPPASMPETVLLAENLPNLIWLADGEKAKAGATRAQIETLRHARCHLAAAVLNRARPPFFRNRLARWLSCAVFCIGLHGFSHQTVAAAPGQNHNFSGSPISVPRDGGVNLLSHAAALI